jgi:hypothetical protein
MLLEARDGFPPPNRLTASTRNSTVEDGFKLSINAEQHNSDGTLSATDSQSDHRPVGPMLLISICKHTQSLVEVKFFPCHMLDDWGIPVESLSPSDADFCRNRLVLQVGNHLLRH